MVLDSSNLAAIVFLIPVNGIYSYGFYGATNLDCFLLGCYCVFLVYVLGALLEALLEAISWTSCSIILPFGPEPWIPWRSIFFCPAIVLANGLAITLSDEEVCLDCVCCTGCVLTVSVCLAGYLT